MKAIISKITFQNEWESKFGTLFQFKCEYDGKVGQFNSKKKEQTTFYEGKEAEFTETPKTHNGVTYYTIKKIQPQGGHSNFARSMKREQSKYSGFAMSYAKDLVVAGKIEEKQIFSAAKKMMDWMVEQDKNLENG